MPIELGQPLLNVQQFPVDLDCPARLFVSLRLLQFGDQFGLASFALVDFLFQSVHDLLLGFALTGARLAELGIEAFLVLPGQGRGAVRGVAGLFWQSLGLICPVLAARRQTGPLSFGLGLVEIILVAPGIMGETAGADVDDMFGQGADQIERRG